MSDYVSEYQIRHKAETDAGEWCTSCGAYIFHMRPPGYRQRCKECKQVDQPGELTHHRYVRCPKCGEKWDPYENEGYELLHDGTHETRCGDCDHSFEVTTHVSHRFVSPERIPESEPEEEQEEDED